MKTPLFLTLGAATTVVLAACSAGGARTEATVRPAGDSTAIAVTVVNHYGSAVGVTYTPVNTNMQRYLGVVGGSGAQKTFYVDYYPNGYRMVLVDEAQGTQTTSEAVITSAGGSATLNIDMSFNARFAELQ